MWSEKDGRMKWNKLKNLKGSSHIIRYDCVRVCLRDWMNRHRCASSLGCIDAHYVFYFIFIPCLYFQLVQAEGKSGFVLVAIARCRRRWREKKIRKKNITKSTNNRSTIRYSQVVASLALIANGSHRQTIRAQPERRTHSTWKKKLLRIAATRSAAANKWWRIEKLWTMEKCAGIQMNIHFIYDESCCMTISNLKCRESKLWIVKCELNCVFANIFDANTFRLDLLREPLKVKWRKFNHIEP